MRLRDLLSPFRSGLCGLAVALLSGHGLKPAPRMAAGWAALTDDATPQSTWAEARGDLGLSWRQAASVGTGKLLLWHWSQPVRGRRPRPVDSFSTAPLITLCHCQLCIISCVSSAVYHQLCIITAC